jgi:hypothetical protein
MILIHEEVCVTPPYANNKENYHPGCTVEPCRESLKMEPGCHDFLQSLRVMLINIQDQELLENTHYQPRILNDKLRRDDIKLRTVVYSGIRAG